MAEPLRVVLSGKCFTALLAKSRTRSKKWSRDVGTHQYSPRYIGTMFSLLGRMPFPVTVLSHLQHQLLTKSPAPSLSCYPAAVKEDESSQGINTQFSLTERSSILSPVTSTAIEQSPLVSLRSFSSLESVKLSQVVLESSACDGNLYPNSQLDLPVLLSDSNELNDDFSEIAAAGFTDGVGAIGKTEEKWGKSFRGQNTPLKLLSGISKRLATGFTDSFEDIGKLEDCCLPHEAHSSSSCWEVGFGAYFSGKDTACCMEGEDILMCDDVLSELMSTWRDEGHSIQQKRNSPQIYEDSETLPDSESFLEEFQCDFDHSPNFLTTKVALPTFESSSAPDTADISPTYKITHSAQYSSLFNSSEKATSGVPLPLQQTPLDTVVQYTPELFTSSASRPSHRASTNTSNTASVAISPAGGAMSPELFSSPRPIVPLAVGKLSSEASRRCTPAAGGNFKQPPKRRLLHPPVQQACTYTPLSSVNDSLSQCFSPELFP
jgi:hypothetical protein